MSNSKQNAMKNLKVYGRSRSRKKKESVGQVETQKSIQPILYQRFCKFVSKSRQAKLITGIYNYYGKNFSIQYKDKFNFRERWQEQNVQYSLDDYLLQDINFAYSTFSIFILIINVFAIWTLSTERYFNTRLISDQAYLYIILIVIKTMEIICRTLLKSKREEWNTLSFKAFLKVNHKEIGCLLFFIYLEIEGAGTSVFENIIELEIYYFLWVSASNIYKNFKLKSFAMKYENQLKIFDLLINIFVQAHIFSILMFCASQIDLEVNWTGAIGIQDAPIFHKYLYAFYFSCTTMLTIGYGDITPKNPGEVMIVILIEITGVVSFGYLLNEMGHTLSKMRQESEIVQKDLQTIGKMAKYYNLEKNLQNRAKKYIITNNIIVDEMRPDQENRLLMKLNDELRTQITNENSLSILKTSIFYLCHWSKGFQSEIAKAFQKRLISPNERLGEASSSERIYIIRTGKVSVYMNRFNSSNKKLIRTIIIDPEKEVSNNIYGYTSCFSNRPVHLEAIAKELTTTYSITKEHFLSCVSMDRKDFEYFHEIKCNIDQSSFCQEWQAPAIKSIRQHYIPSKIFLIKKYRAKLTRQTNLRTTMRRRAKNKQHLINNFIMSNAENVNNFSSTYTLGERTLQFKIASPSKLDSRQRHPSLIVTDQNSEQSEKIIKPFSSSSLSEINEQNKSFELARDFLRTRKQTTAMEENENKLVIAYIFEKRRDYSNFFPKNNFNHVMLRCEKENCLERGHLDFGL